MSTLKTGGVIARRRSALGLTQAQLAKMANVSLDFVTDIESIDAIANIADSNQSFHRILYVLGLNPTTLDTDARKKKKGLWMAAMTCSVSYKHEMTSDQLHSALVSGLIPTEITSNLRHFLDEAPIAIVVMAVEESSSEVENRVKIWRNIASMAVEVQAHRANIYV